MQSIIKREAISLEASKDRYVMYIYIFYFSYIKCLLKCFNRRVLMTCDDSLTSKDAHAYLYEFLWNKIILQIFFNEFLQPEYDI